MHYRDSCAQYPEGLKFMREPRVEGSEEAVQLIEKITAASSIYEYAHNEEITALSCKIKPDQESIPIEAVTDETSSWDFAEEVVSPTEMTAPPISAQSDITETSNIHGFDQAELPTETTPDDFKALFRAIDQNKAAKAKAARIKGRTINTSERTLIKAAEDLIKQAQELSRWRRS